jgi:hypothetical protein
LDVGGESDGVEDEVRGSMPSWKTRNRNLEDFPRAIGRPLNYYNSEDELMSFW